MNQPNSAFDAAFAAAIKGPSMMTAFEFTAEDLAANRAGTVTESQRTQLKATGGKLMVQMVVAVGVVILIAVIYILFTPRGEDIRNAVSANPIIAAAGIGVTILFYVLMLLYSFIAVRSTTSGTKVKSVTGPYKANGRPLRALDGTVYQRIKIGRRDFMIKLDQANMFTPKANYKVYFTGGGQSAMILSVESA